MPNYFMEILAFCYTEFVQEVSW